MGLKPTTQRALKALTGVDHSLFEYGGNKVQLQGLKSRLENHIHWEGARFLSQSECVFPLSSSHH